MDLHSIETIMVAYHSTPNLAERAAFLEKLLQYLDQLPNSQREEILSHSSIRNLQRMALATRLARGWDTDQVQPNKD